MDKGVSYEDKLLSKKYCNLEQMAEIRKECGHKIQFGGSVHLLNEEMMEVKRRGAMSLA